MTGCSRLWRLINPWRLELAARMKLLVDTLEAGSVDVGVDLRRTDAGVAEHFLHLAQVGAAGQ